MKNIVLLGPASSYFFKEYIKNVLIDNFEEISVLTYDNKWDEWSEWYFDKGIKIYKIGVEESWKCLADKERKMLVDERRRDTFAKFQSIDVLQVHFCAGPIMYCYKQLVPKSKRCIMSYWGSDLLRVDKYDVDLNVQALQLSDIVTVVNEKLQNRLISYYDSLVSNKCRIIDFGGVVYDEILNYEKIGNRESAKEYWEINSKDITIMIGYNGIREQQHLNVINVLKKLSKEDLNKITLVFHVGYGLTGEYLQEMEQLLGMIGCKYRIIKEFLAPSEIAKLRMACDIFVHAQTTDAMSASIKEYLYAGCVLLNPKWIDYKELKDAGVMYYEYNTFEEIPTIIKKIGSVVNVNNTQLALRRKIIDELASWERWKPLWLDACGMSEHSD